MENSIWLVVVARGAGLLGAALAYGSFMQSRRKSVLPLVGLAVVIGAGIAISMLVRRAPTTPTRPADQQGTHFDRPAAPSRENALPASATPND